MLFHTILLVCLGLTVGCALWTLISIWRSEYGSPGEAVMWSVAVLVTGSLISFLAGILVDTIHDEFFVAHPVITLREDEWECTHSYTQTHLQPILIGKTTVLMPQTMTYCDQYSRRG